MKRMRMLAGCGAAALMIPAIATAQDGPVTIHVAPGGNDRAPGTQARPVRTLTRAQALVRQHNARRDVTVMLADGTYSLDAPLLFRRADGGLNGHKVIWKAAEGAHPMLSGGMVVTGFKPFDEERRLYVADVPKGIDARQLWVDDTLAERPWMEVRAADLRFGATGFDIVNPDLQWLSTLKRPDRLEMEATGFFTDRVSPVKAIDGARVTMAQPAWDNNSWGYDTITKPIFPQDSRLFLVNALEFVGKANEWHSKPYQWVVDPQAGKLYLRMGPDEDIAQRRVVLPRLETLVSISGTPDAPVEGLRFEGLRFSHSSWMGPSRPTGYANQQSGSFLSDVSPIRPADAWETCGWGCVEFESMRQKWHQMPAAVQVSAARDILFQGNQFSQLGQIGLGIGNNPDANLSGVGLATGHIRVSRNRFTILSGSAIMAGGIRVDAHHPKDAALINRDLVIEDNIVATVSQDYKDNAAILTTYISGARIAHNDISDAPYDGIAVGWGWGYNDAGGNPNYDENARGYVHNVGYATPTTLRDTMVEGNRIHGVKTWFMDGGAIYNLSANPDAVIRGNHIFDIGDKIAIYLDEGSKHFRVTGNVVETRGKWLNINTAGKMYRRRISTDNVATGNWHISNSTGGRWLAEIGNVARDNILQPNRDWPADARKVIDEAGVRPLR
ncbi:right-handed parallel beta-helix repeat-containing protein [Sphingobium sp.]|uniref:right-handed parallel beta-helix repeat-containing protein n=1 Tax=Sphingobium sp. TaxID=1912891 RepID=UPI003B3A2700